MQPHSRLGIPQNHNNGWNSEKLFRSNEVFHHDGLGGVEAQGDQREGKVIRVNMRPSNKMAESDMERKMHKIPKPLRNVDITEGWC